MWNVNGHFPTCKDEYFQGTLQHGSDICISYAALPNYAALEDSEEWGDLLQAFYKQLNIESNSKFGRSLLTIFTCYYAQKLVISSVSM